MMTRSGEWEERTLTVIKQGVYFADYARMILSALKAGDAQDESDELVGRRAREMRRDSWPARLRGGDGTAWREMLLAFVAGDVPREEVFAELTDESRFAASPLAALAMPRAALLCEAHFYDAVRARKAGDAAAMAAALRAAVAADYPAYYEHAMARFLLAEEERR
jgi:lipoprotein NlpI